MGPHQLAELTQMQEVFIGQLDKIAEVFSTMYPDKKSWPVQFVVTTHSPHMANKTPFSAMRYFLSTPVPGMGGICTSSVKDLKRGFDTIPDDDAKFLHQYMTLTRCDLLFADKAVLVEGLSERLLVPVMIQKRDARQAEGSPLLGSQYLSIVEVGGAYAHLFFDLLRFLELRTLVITDLDSVTVAGGTKCPVREGASTSNECIKKWFSPEEVTPDSLLAMPAQRKVDGCIRIAYPIPEAEARPCGRSLEAAFMLANSSLFGGAEEHGLSEAEAWVKSEAVKKSEFALKYAITDTEWAIPKYISEGLEWLAQGPACNIAPEVAVAEQIAEVVEELAHG